MADVKWIKITTDIFDDEKILLIESLPDSYAIITVWFKLLCLAGKQNNSGVFMMGRVAYTDKMLATIFRMKESTVTMALHTFEQFGMVEIIDGVITIPNWNKHQSLDAYEKKKERDRLYQAERRANQRALIGKSSDNQTTQSSDVAVSDIDIEEDKEKDKIKNKKDIRHKYGEYQNVLLTDTDMEKLKAEFPADYEERIERLSSYIASTGKSYKNHLATIRNWARKDAEKVAPKVTPKDNGSFDTDDFFEAALRRGLKKEQPKTAADDEDIRRRAEALKGQLS